MNQYAKLIFGLAVASAISAASVTALLADDDVISEVMKKYHKAPKGTDPVCKVVSNGEGTKAQLEELLAAYESIAKEEPPTGDADSWKEKTGALVSSVKDLQGGKDGALDAYKKAVNCKACHSEHKP
ncbi:MAG: hypothetical protein KDN19_16530 [Verrucomicrobiae bacterium]|nr:hypothetical protein [Verrucomicrobiae bacterium]